MADNIQNDGIGTGSTGTGESAENTTPRRNEDRGMEQERVRSSNDRDQELEREGVESEHNRGYDEAVRGASRPDVDPDSAVADVDRDDVQQPPE